MMEILAIADEYRIPIISDEVYYGLSYNPDRPFHSMGNLTSTVPVICTSALSKIYCVPGWRCGWTIVYNNQGYFDKVLDNLGKHSMILLHPNSLVQHALPRILGDVPDSFFTELKLKLKTAADAAFLRLSSIKGIKPIHTSAAMYMMVGIDTEAFADITDDIDFCKKLLQEQNCLTFPSQCFFSKNFFRIIICTKPEILNEFGDRLQTFCNAHYK
jgi:tyrosine aminotransferase